MLLSKNWLNEDSLLNTQLKEYKKNNPGETLQLEITYPEDYPFEPPFVRVLSPLLFKGHVHHGGAICLEVSFFMNLFNTDGFKVLDKRQMVSVMESRERHYSSYIGTCKCEYFVFS